MSDALFDETLTNADRELLALIIEECSEVIQACTKTLRHGYLSYDPTVPEEERISNSAQLDKEVGHLLTAVSLLIRAGILNPGKVQEEEDKKAATIQMWLHHSERYARGWLGEIIRLNNFKNRA